MKTTEKKTELVQFWNISEQSENEGEILLYGDILPAHPVDFWTGQKEEGLFITPKEFLEDLKSIQNKTKITVKLNSCGGDLDTGIAIYHTLKSLTGEVHIIVDGIAASAASVILCAADKAYGHVGSLVMIHGVGARLRDFYKLCDLQQIVASFDASERAVAEIYHEKTGIPVEELREKMTTETWMTGKEAVELGFLNELLHSKEPDMELRKSERLLLVNGISHDISGFCHVPTIKNKSSKGQESPDFFMPKKEESEDKKKKMKTVEELKSNYPELVAQLQDAVAKDAVQKERARLQEIESISNMIPDDKLLLDAKYGEGACTAQELSFRAMQNFSTSGRQFLSQREQETSESGVELVSATPEISQEEQEKAEMDVILQAYKQTKGGNV